MAAKGLRLLAAGLVTWCCVAAQAAEVPPPVPCAERASDAASAVPARLPGLRYRCMVLGDGRHVLVGQAGERLAPTVLLVHGLGNNAHRDWASTIPALSSQFHVVALDLPGFGASDAAAQGYSFQALGDAMSQVLAQTAPDRRVHLVGHSLGGAAALYFAHTHPEKIDRLVLVDAAGILLKSVFVQHVTSVRTRQVGIEPVDRFLKDLSGLVNGVKRAVFNDMDERFDFSRWLARNPGVRYALLGRYTQVEAGLGLVEHDFTAAIRDTTAPTTVIWGRDDPVAPLRTGHMLAARMPDARLRVIDGVGHTPMEDSPNAFNGLLLEALAAPLAPRQAVDVPEASQGDVVCRDAPDQRYSGRFDSLTLENCANARIEQASLKQLTLKSSSVTVNDSVVDSSDVALSAQDSQLTATSVQLRGRVAIRAADSRLDLAGVSLQARERGVETAGTSRLQFSVSDWRGTDYTGDAHFLWPQAEAQR